MSGNNGLGKLYDRLTPEERFRLDVEAMARGDKEESRLLVDTCPRHTYKMTDLQFSGRWDGAIHLCMASLGVRLMIASNTRSGSVENPLATAAKGVFDGTIETAQDLKKALASLTPTNQEFQTAFETARVSNARLARYYLRSMELTAKGESEPYFIPQNDQQVINLEHILPKKPEDNWPDWTEEDMRLYTTRLGNQVLLRVSDNSKLKSEAFSEKRTVYADCPYVLTNQVGRLDKWTRETIAQRQKKLAQLAVNTWPAKV